MTRPLNMAGDRDLTAQLMFRAVCSAVVDLDLPAPSVGRYTILRRLGSGATGTVFAAHDPKLDRMVALKLLHGRSQAHREHLVREAQTLARLDHLHVVTIHDVETHGSDAYLVMELIEGSTLRHWVRAGRTDRDVMRVFLECAEALHAAHLACVVHGDFKPDNVLITTAGSAKVVDFGLGDTDNEMGGVGTPGYMAPELLSDSGSTMKTFAARANADQYAYCVSLFEALIGRRLDPTEEVLPGWFRRRARGVLKRGLSKNPGDRFPSMKALASALTPSHRPLLIAVAIALVGVISVAVALTAHESDACKVERFEGQYMSRLGAVDSPRLSDVLGTYGQLWATAQQQVCVERPPESSTSQQCLSLLLIRVEAIKALGPAHEPLRASLLLPAPEDCLLQVLPTPHGEEERAAVESARAELARGQSFVDGQWFPQALEHFREANRVAREIGFAPLEAEASTALGWMEFRLDLETAEETFLRALAAAAKAHDARSLAWSATGHLSLVTIRDPKLDIGGWRRLVDAMIFAQPDVRIHAGYLSMVAKAHAQRYEFDKAEELYERVLAMCDEAPKRLSDVTRADTVFGLAEVLDDQGKNAPALGAIDENLALVEQLFGTEHPIVAETLYLRGNILRKMARFDEAEETLTHGKRIFVGDMSSLSIADFDSSLSDLYRQTGRFAEALEALMAARGGYLRRYGEDHEMTLASTNRLARLELRQGQLEEAEAHARAVYQAATRLEYGLLLVNSLNILGNIENERDDLQSAAELYATSLREAAGRLGPGHPEVAVAASNVGEVSLKLGRFSEAKRYCQQALAIDEETLGAEHPDLAYSLTCLGEAMLASDEEHSALSPLKRAWTLRKDSHAPARVRAQTAFALARAYWLHPKTRSEATPLARMADALLAEDGTPKDRRRVEAWLRAH